MPFKPTLVALPVDPVAFPYLGYPLTEIVLEQDNGEGSALPHLPTPDARDKITEAVTGSDVRVNRRKLTDIEFDIDYISDSKKAEIERLYHDARSVYLSPNFGPDTMFSVPFQRTEFDITGNRTFACSRTGTIYKWDDTDKVFHSWSANDVPIAFRGAWSRYYAGNIGYSNKADKPHPDSSSTGWTASTGTATIAYSEDVLSPVLEKRGVTNGKGVTIISGVLQTPLITARHTSANTLSSSNNVIGSVCFACQGNYIVALTNPAGTTIYDSVSATGDGTFKLIKLSGANSDATTQADIRITFVDNYKTDVLAMIGPVYIASESAALTINRLADWVETSHAIDNVETTDSVELILPEMTLSCFVKYAEDQYTAIAQLGGVSTGCHFLYSDPNMRIVIQGTSYYWTDMTEYNLTEGEWYHLVFTGGSDGVNMYVNGIAHSDNSVATWFPVKETASVKVGIYASYSQSNAGISHVRLDRRVWSVDEIQDHYDTYFASQGRGNLEPTFGKEMIIDEMEWELRPGDDNRQWLGRIVLRELGVEEDYAPMQRQEDM